MNILNHRMPGESAVAYRHRRRAVKKLVDGYLKRGTPATHSRDKSHFSGEGRAQPARDYVPGPHPSHKPHEVKQQGMVLGPAGAPRPHTWTVMHPGTLVKA